MLDYPATVFAQLVQDHPYLALAIFFWKQISLSAIERGVKRFVTFVHRMRLQLRRLRADPDVAIASQQALVDNRTGIRSVAS